MLRQALLRGRVCVLMGSTLLSQHYLVSKTEQTLPCMMASVCHVGPLCNIAMPVKHWLRKLTRLELLLQCLREALMVLCSCFFVGVFFLNKIELVKGSCRPCFDNSLEIFVILKVNYSFRSGNTEDKLCKLFYPRAQIEH